MHDFAPRSCDAPRDDERGSRGSSSSEEGRELPAALATRSLQLPQLLCALRRHGRRFRQLVGVEDEPGRRTIHKAECVG